MNSSLGLDVRLLGPLEVRVDGAPVTVRGRRPRALLCVLALAGGRPVPVEELTDRIWGEGELPADVRGSLHTYVHRLRSALGVDAVVAAYGGYRLAVEPDAVDAVRFTRLLEGSPQPGHDALVEALELWRDTPFTEPLADWLTGHEQPRLIEHYLTTLEQRVDLDLAAGRHADLVAELRQVVARHPLREPLWHRLLLALERSGRRSEALEAYETVRSHLADELGVDPGAELKDIYARLLVEPEQTTAGLAPESTDEVAPRQLPADPDGFVKRDDLLTELDVLLDESRPQVMAIHGPGGVGKTSLAVHWVRCLSDRFPDGQLFLNLRGYGPVSAMTAEEALETLLSGLGIIGTKVPATVEARAALLRSTLATRRMALVLDNARDAQQVRPLLPGAGNLVVVTSRSQLRGLSAREGAARVAVGYLPHKSSVAMLRARLGEHASVTDTELGELADMCGHLPLALAVAAERAGRSPTQSHDLIRELREETDRLNVFESPDDPLTDLRGVFSWSYHALDDDTARAFRLLGLHPGGCITPAATAALAGIPIPKAHRLLDRLAGANLVLAARPGAWVLHDLLQVYALELAREVDGNQQCHRATRRLISHYVHSSRKAADELFSYRGRLLDMGDPIAHVPVIEFADPTEARVWFDNEWTTLALLVDHSLASGDHHTAARLVYNTFTYLMHNRPPAESLTMQQRALAAVEAADWSVATAVVTNMLGVSWARSGETHRAKDHFESAVSTFSEIGHETGQGIAYNNLAEIYIRIGHHGACIEALERALAIHRRIGDKHHEASNLQQLAEALKQAGRYDEALSAATTAVKTAQGIDNTRERGLSLRTRGLIHAARGEHQKALEALHAADEAQLRIDRRWDRAVTLFHIGEVAIASGSRTQAVESWLECLSLIDDVGVIDSWELTRGEVEAALRSLDSAQPHGTESAGPA